MLKSKRILFSKLILFFFTITIINFVPQSAQAVANRINAKVAVKSKPNQVVKPNAKAIVAIPKPVIGAISSLYDLGATVNINVTSKGVDKNVNYQVTIKNLTLNKTYAITKGYSKPVNPKKTMVFKFKAILPGNYEVTISSKLVDAAVLVSSNIKKKFKVYNGVSLTNANAKFSSKSVNGDLYIGATNITISNVKVSGTVIINPGASGTVHLNNVNAKKISVLSGGINSIYFNGVNADSLSVDSSSKIRIVANETDINETTVGSSTKYVLFDTVTNAQIGTITIINNGSGVPEIVLQGNFSEPIIIGSSAIVSTLDSENEKTVVSEVQISSDNSNDTVTLNGNFQNVAVNSEMNLLVGDNSSIDSLALEGAAKITVGNGAMITNFNANAAATISGSGTIDTLSGSEASNAVLGSELVINNPPTDQSTTDIRYKTTQQAITTDQTATPQAIIAPTVTNQPPIASLLSIDGTPQVGKTLTGKYTYSDAENDLQGASTFRWLSNSGTNDEYVAIPGATSKTYVVGSSMIGKCIKFEVTPVALSGALVGSPVLSEPSQLVRAVNAPPTALNVGIDGTPQVGTTLTGKYTYSDVENDLEGASTYRWLSNSGVNGEYVAISGATSKTYVVESAMIGKCIKFEVTPIAQSGALSGIPVLSTSTSAVIQTSSVSVSVGGSSSGGGSITDTNAAPTASNVAIDGVALVGNTLTGSYTYYDANSDAEGTSTFRWLANTGDNGSYVAITGATSKTYVINNALVGKCIKFEVTPVAKTGTLTGAAVLSSPTSMVAGKPVESKLQAVVSNKENKTYIDVTSLDNKILNDTVTLTIYDNKGNIAYLDQHSLENGEFKFVMKLNPGTYHSVISSNYLGRLEIADFSF